MQANGAHDHAGHVHEHGHRRSVQWSRSWNTRPRVQYPNGNRGGPKHDLVVRRGGFGFCKLGRIIADDGSKLEDVLGWVFAWTAMYLGRRPPGARYLRIGRSSVLAALRMP